MTGTALGTILGTVFGLTVMGTQAQAQTQSPAPAATPAPAAGTVQLPTLSVEGIGATTRSPDYRSETPALTKLTAPLRDTPQTITTLPRQVLDDRAVTNLNDALRSVPGVSISAGEGGSQGNSLTVRGFAARNDLYLDNMRDFGSYYRDPFDLQKIEVLQGPASVLFGRGSTGGVVHQVSKTPELKGFTEGTIAVGSDMTKRGTLDYDTPLPSLGAGTALRINLMAHDADVAGRKQAENSRYGIAPSLAFGIGTPTRVTLSYLHQSEDDLPDYGLPWRLGRAAPVARDNFYGFTSDYLKTDADVATVKIEHDLTDRITLRNQTRYAHYTRDFRITEPQTPATVTGATPLSSIAITRNQLAGNSVETFAQNQSEIAAKFRTGFIRHSLVGGIEFGRETSDPNRFTYTGVSTASLLNPNPYQAFTGVSAPSSRAETSADTFGVYLVDSLKLSEQWEVTGGIRWDSFAADFKQTVAPATAFKRTDTSPSYRGGIVYKPVEFGSIYFGYGTSFNPSAEALSLQTATANLAPEKSRSFEIGTKWDLLGEKLTVQSAIFRLEKTNARVPDPTNTLFNTLGGDQKVDGFSIDASGRVTDKWQVYGGYAYMDSRVTQTTNTTTSPILGAQLTGTPRHSASLWTTYDLPEGFQVGGGANYQASRLASNTAARFEKVPAYLTLDAVVKYQLNEHIGFQLNVYNLTDKYYLDQLHPAHVVPGAGRTVLLSTNFKY